MVEVVAALIKKDNKYLIAKRLEGKYQGLWEFPGGKVELGESDEEAIEREIYEELELVVKANDFIANNVYEYPDKTVNLKLYECIYQSGDIKLNNHSEYKFVSVDELDSYNYCPADVYFLNIIKKRG